MPQIAFVPILVCFVFGIIRVSLAAIPGQNSSVSVAGSWTLLRMHFAEFLKLFDIFARFNFSNFSSLGKLSNVLFNFYILHGAETYYWCVFSSECGKYKTQDGSSRVVFNLENQTFSNPTNSRNTFSGLLRTNFIFGKVCKVKLVSGFRFFWWNFACYQFLSWNASSTTPQSGGKEAKSLGIAKNWVCLESKV